MSASYEKQIEELYRKVPSYQVVGSRAYKPGIETMTEFDLALGHPHADYPTVHIAGTNGKGSVSSMMAVALAAQGFKVALYTSPHLVDFRERIKIVHNGKYRMIPKAAVSRFLAKWNSFIEENNPSFFEITTAMAFDWFASQKVDYAVIETGLGGRLDSTNVITPKVSIITNIGLEHCMYLGNTLGEIAFEKAGIIKEGVPVVIGQSTPETLPVFQKVAAQKHSHLILSQNRDISDWKIEPGEMDLKGEYQIDNLKTVIAALQVLGIPQSEKVIYSLEHCASISGLHGRWEMVRKPSGDKAAIICDIGHNAHGLKPVFGQLAQCTHKYDTVYVVFAVVADKDVESVGPLMVKPSSKFKYIFTESSTQRALPVGELAHRLAPYGIKGRMEPSVAEAITYADGKAGGNDLIFVGGSNFTVADALTFLNFAI